MTQPARPQPKASTVWSGSSVPGAEDDYDGFDEEQDSLDFVAAMWVARQSRGLDAEARAELDAWLSADPDHQAAFDDMADTFGRLQGISEEEFHSLKAELAEDEALVLPAGTSAPVPTSSEAERPHRPSLPRPASPARRHWLATLVHLVPQATAATLGFGVVGGGWLGWERWRRRPTFDREFRTALGQQLRVRLPDDTFLEMDTGTQIGVRLFDDRREVDLREGQAMFSVRSDPGRPFHVRAGSVRVTVVGTRFVVRHTKTGLDAGDVRVAVEEGRVRVARLDGEGNAVAADGADSRVELTPGESILADMRGYLGTVMAIAPGSAATWRNGRVTFDATPLAQALAEFGRYGETATLVRDSGVAAMRVGGSFSLSNLPGFLQSLSGQLPVRLVQRDGMTEIVPLH